MTPKRYMVFGCLTVLIQGAVFASQNTEAEPMLSSGAALGSKQAVSVSIAMQARQSQSAAAKPIKSKAEPELKPEPKPIVKPKPVAKAEPTIVEKIKPQPQKPTPKVAEVAKETEQPTKREEEQVQAALAQEPEQEQEEVKAKQGVTQELTALTKPTFAVPPTPPHYPKLARKRGFEGTAMIEVKFDQSGEPLDLVLVSSSGYRLLDKAALKAVKKWRFTAPSPQTSMAYTVRIPVKFALNGAA